MCSVVFLAFPLKLPIHNSLSVAPKLPISLSSAENCRKFRKTSTSQVCVLNEVSMFHNSPLSLVCSGFSSLCKRYSESRNCLSKGLFTRSLNSHSTKKLRQFTASSSYVAFTVGSLIDALPISASPSDATWTLKQVNCIDKWYQEEM